MKNGRILFRAGLAVLLVVGLMVSAAMAHNQEKKACCGSCGGTDKVAAAKAGETACCGSCGGAAKVVAKAVEAACPASGGSTVAACTATASKQCPVQHFMTRLSRVELTESQIQKMMVIWTGTEKKMTALLTPTQLAKLKAPLPIQEQLAAQVVARMSGSVKPAVKACCGSCGGAAKTAAKACCGTCGGSDSKSCTASSTATSCSAGSK